MFKKLTLAVLLLCFSASVALGQSVVPRWQHSIFNPSVSVDYYKSDGKYHTNAFNGMGYMFSWTVYDKGSVNLLGVGLVNVIRMSSSNELFTWTVGPNVNFGGNFGVGAGWTMIDTENQEGVAIGKGRGAPNSFWFSLYLPLNGGGLVNLWNE